MSEAVRHSTIKPPKKIPSAPRPSQRTQRFQERLILATSRSLKGNLKSARAESNNWEAKKQSEIRIWARAAWYAPFRFFSQADGEEANRISAFAAGRRTADL